MRNYDHRYEDRPTQRAYSSSKREEDPVAKARAEADRLLKNVDQVCKDVSQILREVRSVAFDNKIILRTLNGPLCAECGRGNRHFREPQRPRYHHSTAAEVKTVHAPTSPVYTPTSPVYVPTPAHVPDSLMAKYIQANGLVKEGNVFKKQKTATKKEKEEKVEKEEEEEEELVDED